MVVNNFINNFIHNRLDKSSTNLNTGLIYTKINCGIKIDNKYQF